MDSFFKPRFNAGKCKTLLKLSIPRIKLLRNRREIQIKQMRKEIAKLLETGQEATARIRVEHIIREEKMMAAQEIVELFCELIAVRLPIIEAQKECPLDLKEAISSVCFAAPRCADLPELLQVQILFSGKYGKEFVAAATELMPECGVNRQLVELLSIRAPAPDVKLKLLTEIAEEHGLDWDPSATEHELLKKHEDLLSGPTQFNSGSKLPLPKEKHETIQTSTSEPVANEISDDEDFDIVDFPEVPNIPLKTNKGNTSTPEMLPFPVSALSEEDNEESNPTAANNIRNPIGPNPVVLEKPVASTKVADNQSEGGLFVPLETPQSHSSPFPKEKQNSTPVASTTSVDLQDVLAAAQAAAETAERAAAAARSAASIAQLRISELVNRKNDAVPTPENTVFKDGKDGKIPLVDSHTASSPTPNNGFNNGGVDPQAAEYYSSSPMGNAVVSPSTDLHHHQPQRLPSLDDESFFSYPNLFTSQSADLSNRT